MAAATLLQSPQNTDEDGAALRGGVLFLFTVRPYPAIEVCTACSQNVHLYVMLPSSIRHRFCFDC